MVTPDIQGRLVRLRQLLHGAPSARAWESVLSVLRTWPDDRDVEIGVDYALGHLDAWPDTLRVAEPDQVRAALRGDPPVIWPLVRVVTTLAGRAGLEGVEALAQSPHMRHVARLSLQSYGLDDDAAELLAASPHLTGLTHLNLSRNRVTAAGLRRLIGPASRLPERLTLDLRHNALDLPSLGDLPDPAPRVVVVAAATHPRPNTLADLRQALSVPLTRELRVLSVGGSHFGDDLLDHLLDAPHLDHLRMLDLEQCALGERRFDTAIVALLDRFTLTALNLRDNLLTSNALRHLTATPRVRSLHTLDLSGNPLGDEGLRPLLANPHLTGLRTLRLGDCWLTPDAARQLAAADQLAGLQYLDLSQNDLDDRAALLLDAPHLADAWLHVSVRRHAHPALAERLAAHNARLNAPTPALLRPWMSEPRAPGDGLWWGEGSARS